jgi:hypothetical protein
MSLNGNTTFGMSRRTDPSPQLGSVPQMHEAMATSSMINHDQVPSIPQSPYVVPTPRLFEAVTRGNQVRRTSLKHTNMSGLTRNLQHSHFSSSFVNQSHIMASGSQPAHAYAEHKNGSRRSSLSNLSTISVCESEEIDSSKPSNTGSEKTVSDYCSAIQILIKLDL